MCITVARADYIQFFHKSPSLPPSGNINSMQGQIFSIVATQNQYYLLAFA